MIRNSQFSVLSFQFSVLLLLSAFCFPISAFSQDVGDLIIPEKVASTGRVTNRYLPKGASAIMGFNSSSLPARIAVGSGLTLSGTPLTLTASGGGGGGITGINGTANEITVTGTSTRTLSLPSALTFTDKIITGGTFNDPVITGANLNGMTISESSGSVINITAGTTVEIPGPFGTAAFKDYGGDELQLLIWATNVNTDPPASIVTATALGALKRNVTTLPINLGGTNATSASAALNNLLPSQTGSAGRALLTDGSNVAFGLVDLSIGTVGILPADSMPALTGDVTSTAGSVATTIANGAVTNAMLAGSIDLTTKVTGTLPVANGGTGITSLGSGVATWLGTPTLANLNTAVSDADLATTGANSFNGAQTIAVGTNSATPAAGESLTNSTAAISGTQSASPSVIWTGQGWKTTATAASQAVAFRAFALPVQGTTAPTGLWSLQSSINAGAYSTIFSVNSAGGFGNTQWFVDAFGNITNGGANGYIRCAGRGPNLGASTYATSMDDSGPVVGSSGLYIFTDGSSFGGTKDTGLGRTSAGIVQVNNGTLNTRRDVDLRNLFHTDYIEGVEMTPPTNAPANRGRLYWDDNGSGKTRLMVIFPSGAAQQIAIEP